MKEHPNRITQLPRWRCEVKNCLEPARHRVVDRTARGHLACDGHLNQVASRFMRADDCLAVELDGVGV